MGVYLNSRKPGTIYANVARSEYFVDKTAMLEELLPLVDVPGGVEPGRRGGGNRYICITRPRRFGKTVAACMISSFFGEGCDSRSLFEGLRIGRHKEFKKHVNRHKVIHISFNEAPRECATYKQYIDRIQERLLKDLGREFPEMEMGRDPVLWDVLNNIYELEEDVKFIFVLDEWDYIFHRSFVTDRKRADFVDFLSSLLKDQPYVELAYMTGILPIAKYSSGSELNMFFEYTMATREKYGEYFGFTEGEVDHLYARYLADQKEPRVTREGLRLWYDGYQLMSGERVYNPRSVVGALSDNQLGSYWTSSGPYDGPECGGADQGEKVCSPFCTQTGGAASVHGQDSCRGDCL